MLLISILLPVLGAVALFIWRPRDVRACHALTMTATLATSACVAWCIFTPGGHPITLLKLSDLLSISFKLDGLGRVFGGLVAFLWPLSTLYAFEYMAHEGGENHFFGFYLLSYAVTLGIAFAEDLMTLYIFYELLTLATLFLVMHGMKPQAVYAGRKYVYYSLGGAAMAAGGAVWIFGMRALERISEKSGIPDMNGQPEDAAPERAPGPWRVLVCLLPVVAASVMYGLLRDGIITWAPSYLQESFGFPAATSIALTMIVPPVNLGGVYAFNWLRNRLRWSEAATAAAAFAICGAGIALWTAAGRGSVAVTILMLIVSTTCMTGASTMLLSLLPLRFHAMGRMATVTGLLNASAYVGSALASTGFGALSESGGWTAVLAAWLAISAAGMALCFFSRGVGRTDRPAARQSRACGS